MNIPYEKRKAEAFTGKRSQKSQRLAVSSRTIDAMNDICLLAPFSSGTIDAMNDNLLVDPDQGNIHNEKDDYCYEKRMAEALAGKRSQRSR